MFSRPIYPRRSLDPRDSAIFVLLAEENRMFPFVLPLLLSLVCREM